MSSILFSGIPEDSIFNLTSDEVTIIVKAGAFSQVNSFQSKGELSLSTYPQARCEIKGLNLPVIEGLSFQGLDINSPGYKMFTSNPKGIFIVTLQVAQWLRENGKNMGLECFILSPTREIIERGKVCGYETFELYYCPC